MAADRSLFLYSKFETENAIGEAKLNLPTIPKLVQLLKLVETPGLDLTFEENTLKYTSKGLKFKYRIFEDGIIPDPRVSIDRVQELQWNTELKITSKAVKRILKAVSIGGDVNCIALYQNEDGIMAELYNRDSSSSNSIHILVSESITGDLPGKLSLNYETFKFALISANTLDIHTEEKTFDPEDVPVATVKIRSDVKVAVLEITATRTKLFYVMTGLQDND